MNDVHICDCCGSLSDRRTCVMCANTDFRLAKREQAKGHPKMPKGYWPLKKRSRKEANKFPMMLMAKARPWSGILPDLGPPAQLYFLKGNRTPCREKALQREADKPGQRSISDYMEK